MNRIVIAVLVLGLLVGAFVFLQGDEKRLESEESIILSQAHTMKVPPTFSLPPAPAESTVQPQPSLPPVAEPMHVPISPPGSEKLDVSGAFDIFLSLTSVSSMSDDQLTAFYGVSEAELQKLREFGKSTTEATAEYQRAQYTALCVRRNDLISVEEVGTALNDADLAVMRHQENLAAESRLSLGEELFAKLASHAAKTPQKATRTDAIKFMKDTGRSPASLLDRLCRSIGM